MTPTPIDMLVRFSHERSAGGRPAPAGEGPPASGPVTADDERALARRRGFLNEIERVTTAGAQTITVAAPSTLTLGRQGLAQLLDRGAGLDAVFCGSDLLAHGALEEARARRLDIPGALAIIGFGGLEFTEHTFPALSSVTIDREGIGRLAAEEILARIEGQGSPGRVVDVGFTIVDRGTT